MLRSKRPSVLAVCFDRIGERPSSAGFLFRSHTDLGLIGWVNAARCDRFAPMFRHQRLSHPDSRTPVVSWVMTLRQFGLHATRFVIDLEPIGSSTLLLARQHHAW